MKKILSLILAFVMIFSFSFVSFAKESDKPFSNSEFYSYGDYTVHYRIFEPQNKTQKQILLIHGFGLSTASFEQLAQEYVKKGIRTVLVDLPNFGYSSREGVDTKLVSREELVSSLLDYLGGKWVLGGHSMGCGVASNVAVERKDKVVGLVMFSPQGSSTPSPVLSSIMKSVMMRTFFEAIIRYASKSDIVLRALVGMSFSDAEFAKNYDLNKISQPLSVENTGAGMAIMTSHTKSTDFNSLSLLEIPMVIVKTTNDNIANETSLNKFIEYCGGNTKVVTFSEGGHIYMEYNPKSACEVTVDIVLSSF